jgi:hypothetical protein
LGVEDAAVRDGFLDLPALLGVVGVSIAAADGFLVV